MFEYTQFSIKVHYYNNDTCNVSGCESLQAALSNLATW